MANNTEKKLMADFPPVSTEDWEAAINKDLKGSDYERRLVWRTAEGFNVRPYYRAENLKDIEYLGADIGEFPYVRGTCRCNDWRICQTICAKDLSKANLLATKAIEGGATMLNFVMAGSVSAKELDTLLNGIDLNEIELTFSGSAVAKVATLVIDKAERLAVDPKKLKLNFVIDPIVARFSMSGTFGCSKDGSKQYNRVKSLTEKGAKYKGIRYLNVSGENFHNSGSTIVQELAFSLAVGHEYLLNLIERGLSVKNAARAIRFSMAISSNYFMEIAKFRAARMLWANIVNQYDPKCNCSRKMKTHAVTSLWNMTVYDPYVNMLRGTTEAMSAAIASVQSLEVLPFNASYECPDEFSSRIARNVQLLLKNEAHFDNVTDPAGGSYYIETLTDNIAKQAWILFKEIEDKGGYVEAFKAGFIQDAIEESAAKKDMNVATRSEVLLGTNQYPNFSETANKEVTEETVSSEYLETESVCACGGECDCDHEDGHECKCDENAIRHLKLYRGAMAFEQMRLKADRSKKEPKAFMLTCGTLGMARARAQFSSNFFACAGIKIIDNNFFEDVEEGISKALESKAEIVVVCAADDDYATVAPQIKKGLGGKAILVVAGAPKSQPELEAEGITNFISVKSNVLETLNSYLKELGI